MGKAKTQSPIPELNPGTKRRYSWHHKKRLYFFLTVATLFIVAFTSLPVKQRFGGQPDGPEGYLLRGDKYDPDLQDLAILLRPPREQRASPEPSVPGTVPGSVEEVEYEGDEDRAFVFPRPIIGFASSDSPSLKAQEEGAVELASPPPPPSPSPNPWNEMEPSGTTAMGLESVPDSEKPRPAAAFRGVPSDRDTPVALRSIIEVTDSETCKLPRELAPCRLREGERIHLVFVSAMWDREPFTQDETAYILRSILFQTSCKLFVHFLVAGEPEQSLLPPMMDAMGGVRIVPIPSRAIATPSSRHQRATMGGYTTQTANHNASVLYALHAIPTAWVLEQAGTLDLVPLAHHAGVPGMCKFFMADILWQVKRAIYLDVDMVVAGDIQDLWGYFAEHERHPELLYFMGNNHPEGHNRRRLLRPYCSCQLVMDLSRMRRANMTKMVKKALKGRKPKELKTYVEDGDQWLFTWLCKQYRSLCRILPRMWNVSGCTKPVPFLGLNGKGMQVNGSCWRVVHFNCMGHKRGGKGNYRIPLSWLEPYSWVKHINTDQIRRHFLNLPPYAQGQPEVRRMKFKT